MGSNPQKTMPLSLWDLKRCIEEGVAIEKCWVFNAVENAPEAGLAVALVMVEPGADQDSDAAIEKMCRALLRKIRKLARATRLPRDWLIVDRIPVSGAGVDEYELRLRLEKKRTNLRDTSVPGALKAIFLEMLNLSPGSSLPSTSFTQLGGDLAAAMEIAKRCYEIDIFLPAHQILECNSIAELANALIPTEEEQCKPCCDTQAFSLLDPAKLDQFLSEARGQCKLGPELVIEDAYPCTQLQEGLMALAVKQRSSYISKYVYRIAENVAVDRFRNAWERTVSVCSALRTRIVDFEGAPVQVVVGAEHIWSWDEGCELAAVLDAAEGMEMVYGSRLCHSGIACGPDGQAYFVWIMHHAIYDGWTQRLVVDMLHRCYHAEGSPVPPLYSLSRFVEYCNTFDTAGASHYWSTQLQDAKPAAFPRLKSSIGSSWSSWRTASSQVTAQKRRRIRFPYVENSAVTKGNLLRAAWAFLLARYSDTRDICFGTTVAGRRAPLAGLDRVAGPVIATLPIRVQMDRKMTVKKFLENVQAQAFSMVPYEQLGLQRISRLGSDAKNACDFSSLLIVQPAWMTGMLEADARPILEAASDEQVPSDQLWSGYFNYPLVVQVHIHDGQVEFHATYDSKILTETQIDIMSSHFDHIVQQLVAQDESSLDAVSLSGPQDLEQSILWSGEEPQAVDDCVHHLIEQQALRRPTALAIRAWDGEFSYAELDEAATRLAHHLVTQYSVHVEDLVHVCFEKSCWFFVSILAINKAGGAWVPLNPSHPIQRQQEIIRQTKSKLVLTSPAHREMCARLGITVVQVEPALDLELSQQKPTAHTASCPAPYVSPQNAAYVLFTSGSTGTPKGIVMEHASLCTSQTAIVQRLGLTPGVRMLQFASYVFDLCIGEIIATLISGACLCIPSDNVRVDGLAGFIRDMNVNWAFLTPAFVRTLNPEDIPGLELLLLAGEAVSRDILETWFSRVRLVNGWGPAETCVFSTLNEWKSSSSESPLTVGKPVGGSCWIVNSDDPTLLAPIGCVGEVIIQGPTVLREYLSDQKRTKEAIMTQVPSWAPRRAQPRWNRAYKSGDLAYYNPDGTIEFVGRKDTQIKIRGLRVEPGEVEHHIRKALEGVQQVAVDVLKTDTSASLVSYLCFNKDTKIYSSPEVADIFLPLTDELQHRIVALIGHLSIRLPRYMIPTIFIPCRHMPFVTSTKLDRRTLKKLTGGLGQNEMARYSLVDSKKQAPETAMEVQMQGFWASILRIPSSSIGRDDSFLQIGGDSISAIQLTSLARRHDIELTAASIFEDARLWRVAASAKLINSEGTSLHISAFSLLPTDQIGTLLLHAREQCGLNDNQVIEDAYPCTPLQEGLMALALKHPGSYISKYLYKLPEHIDISRFKHAWNQTVSALTNLRTRIVFVDGQSIQVVIRNDDGWDVKTDGDLESTIKSASKLNMVYGSRLCRYTLVAGSDGHMYFLWTIHHSVNDGWSLGILRQQLQSFYHDCKAPALQPYSRFIKHITELDLTPSREYWTSQLQGARQTHFPPRAPKSQDDKNMPTRDVSRAMTKTVSFPEASEVSSVTKATAVRATWAILLGRYCDTDDVCFGTTVTGRQAPVPGIESMVGPVIASVPIRVRLAREETVSRFLDSLQSHAMEMVPYEQFGLQNISRLSSNAHDACDFSSLLVIQPSSMYDWDGDLNLIPTKIETALAEDLFQGYYNYPLVLQCVLYNGHAELHALYDTRVMAELQVTALLAQFDHVVQQLLGQGRSNMRLGDMSLAGEWDLQQALQWMPETAPESVDSCVHDLISTQAVCTPAKTAIYAWDGTLTYAELEQLSTQLARHLIGCGLQRDMMVPICFEKSKWSVVAMIAVLKAGGAFVPLDPSHPHWRRQTIVKETDASLILVSASTAALCVDMAPSVIVLSDKVMLDLSSRAALEFPELPETWTAPGGSSVAWVLFTSGSTGTPKGIILEHSAACYSIKTEIEAFGVTTASRMLQFSSLTFDMALSEIFTSLAAGGTICIPSEGERNQDIAGWIRSARVNIALLTASFANTFRPAEVPTLDTLVLSGESPTRDVVQAWCEIRLINGYGPTETNYCTSHQYLMGDDSPTTIGRPFNCICWVVEPDNHQHLAPIGCVGELLVQGPTLARGYLNNEKATNASFISNLEWLPSLTGNKGKAFYKTGDLVKYNPDGTLEYMGRKDTQVKLRGQRLELGEIEYHIKKAVPSLEHVVVEMVHHGPNDKLVAFLSFMNYAQEAGTNGTDNPIDNILPIDKDTRATLSSLLEELSASLPTYMVPTLFLPLRKMPFSISMKIDRMKLRALVPKLTVTALAAYSLANKDTVEVTTQMEFKLRQLWAEVIEINAEEISKSDNFFQLGGDSINAIKLASLARTHHIRLDVASIFNDARLVSMAANAELLDGAAVLAIEPFSLIPTGQVNHLLAQAREQCGLAVNQVIEDAYPCTPLQEGLMALTVKQPGSYVAKLTYQLGRHIDEGHFRRAWTQTVARCKNLRTRIVLIDDYAAQIVIKDDSGWVVDSVNRSRFSPKSEAAMSYGSQLCRHSLVKNSDGQMYFKLFLHHSIFDGWSINLALQTLHSLYHEAELPKLQPYSHFIKYLHDIDKAAARKFWETQLSGATRASFPPQQPIPHVSDTTSDCEHMNRYMATTVPFSSSSTGSITKATFIRAAWAIVLAHYCETDDVCFGTSVSGRQAPVPGLDRMSGQTVSTVPVRVRLDSRQSVRNFLQSIQKQASDMVPYEQFGLQNISKLSAEARDSCDFTSLLAIQPAWIVNPSTDSVLSLDKLDRLSADGMLEGYTNYPLVVQGHLHNDHVDFIVLYDSRVLNEARVTALSNHFNQVIQQLLTQDRTLADVSLVGPWDIEQANLWNSNALDVVDACVHHLIEKQAQERPNAPAICAWDGMMTYAELDDSARRLANHLMDQYALTIEDLVHVCFEKSIWFFVSVLAVNKAGGAWVPLDPSHPMQRQQQVTEQIKAKLALVSHTNAEICAGLGLNVVQVDSALDKALEHEQTTPQAPNVSPRNAAYVLFTSGSTGVPKGVVVEHRSVCTAQKAISHKLGMNPDIRMLQFSSYVFDACIYEAVFTLIAGGCLYVPSDYTRMNDLTQFILDMEITWAVFTPAYIRTLEPQQVPTLEVLVVGGEAAGRDILDIWFGKVRLVNIWGPTETCVISSLHEWRSIDESPLTIGRPINGNCWLVDLKDPRQLAPIGSIGEVIIQGPNLLREYLSDAVKTEESIVTMSPTWVTHNMDWNRFYKSGDLAFYNSDGTLEFAGRKDRQVKIRGLRVELGDIEYNIRTILTGAKQVVVDILKTAETVSSLVCYFSFGTAPQIGKVAGTGTIFLPQTCEIESQILSLVKQLKTILPHYMVPTIFIPCQDMPFITSTKLDRNQLHQLTAKLSRDDLARYSLVATEKQAPQTSMEAQMQSLWATTLKIPIENIGRDDSFLQIGGDSIAAIRLVALARHHNIELTVGSIFQDPRLSHVAAAANLAGQSASLATAPLSLLRDGLAERVLDQAVVHYALTAQNIEDAYPCTTLQEGLVALAVKQPGSYIAKLTYKLSENVDVRRFRHAWSRTILQCSNLRTRIILVDGHSTQLVIKADPDHDWDLEDYSSLDSAMESVHNAEMAYGSPLCLYGLAKNANGDQNFVLALHHSIYDGWTMALIMKTLAGFYYNTKIAAYPPYSSFIKYVAALDGKGAADYWRTQLHGAQKSSFPPQRSTFEGPNSKTGNHVSRSLRAAISFPPSANVPTTSITKATVLRAAWAIVISRYCDTDDICFGVTVSGRHASVPGLEDMPGPTVATVPVRVRGDPQQTVAAFMDAIQRQSSEMVPYEQFGLQNISKLSAEARDACDFDSLFAIQPAQLLDSAVAPGSILTSTMIDQTSVENLLDGYFNYSLVAQGIVYDDHAEFLITYDSRVLEDSQIEALSHHFDQVLQQLFSQDQLLLRDVSLAGLWDLQQAIGWNAKIPVVNADECAHRIISSQALRTPDADAVVAWDGSLTYAELERLSDQLCHSLINNGARPGMIIPFCMEKSKWPIVAMIGIMKTGAAFVPLDPSHPISRRESLVRELGAEIFVVSPSIAPMCAHMVLRLVILSEILGAELSVSTCANPYIPSSLDSLAYLIFTSGTTGTPKGIEITHGTLSSSIRAHAMACGINNASRYLQFSSYVFDAAMSEIFATLVCGGTICVPSDAERLQNITDFIRRTQANIALLTPSFTGTFSPNDVPSMKTLMIGGEAPTRDSLRAWYGRVRLFNAYGPTETCIYCTIHEYRSPDDSPRTIGQGFNNLCWIVDANNHHRLAPIGCVGELLIQGSTLARGYFRDKEKTLSSFLDSVAWLPKSSSLADRPLRFYKTGDLVRYNTNGTIEYVGRKDTQVKLRGHRIELGEIEYRIKTSLPSVERVAVDVAHRNFNDMLVAFFKFSKEHDACEIGPSDNHGDSLLMPVTTSMKKTLKALMADLQTALPPYMVPTVFLPLHKMLFGTSLKIDRKKLQALAAGLTADEVATYSLTQRDTIAPTTEMELKLRGLWSEVLKIPAEEIGKDDSFLQIGGDSISAIQLASLARRDNIELTVASIFRDSRLSQVAAAACYITESSSLETAPFSLLPAGTMDKVLQHARGQCSLSNDQVIEDAYPCTPFQSGIMALAIKHPGSYLARYVYKLPQHIDIDLFKEAWARTVSLCVNLRTRIVFLDGYSAQVVIKNDVQWYPLHSHGPDALESTTEFAMDYKTTYGSKLCHYNLSYGADGSIYFNLAMHHSIFDGWSMSLLVQTLHDCYHGTPIATIPPYSRFIKYIGNLDSNASKAYWSDQLHEAKKAMFPRHNLTLDTYYTTPSKHRVTRSLTRSIHFPPPTITSITKATVLRGAWALVLARYCNMDDICFGATISGRQAPVPGLHRMVGPLLATVPVRVRLDRQQTAASFLREIQQHAADMIAFEQFGLQNIMKLGADAKDVCDFTSLLSIQPASILASFEREEELVLVPTSTSQTSAEDVLDNYLNYPLVVQIIVFDEYVDFNAIYNSQIITEAQIEALSHHFDEVVQQLVSESETLLANISLAGPWDIEQATRWNTNAPKVIDTCIHHLIEQQSHLRPDAPAIHAWDGEFTYAELDDAAYRLAHHLSQHGIGTNDLVHICFGRSTWSIVAILAINKSGCAWVPLDPLQPLQYQQEVIRQTSARLALTATAHRTMCNELGLKVIEVGPALDSVLKTQAGLNNYVTPSLGTFHDAAYVLFEPDNANVPKGAVVEHGSICTAHKAVSERLRMGPDIRMLQISSPVSGSYIIEVIFTLISGGCLSIPRDDTPMDDLARFTYDLDINWAILSPTYIQNIMPEQVPNLKVLILRGGDVTRHDFLKSWFGKVRLVNVWGLIETCVISSLYEWESIDDSPLTMGSPVGCYCWVVDPENPYRLAPTGSIGEMVVQGPTLLREYLKDPDRTAGAVIKSLPSWVPEDIQAQWGHFYKSGELGFYNSNGSIELIGKKGEQAKIGGLDVKLGEVEQSIRMVLNDVEEVVVDIVKSEDAGVSLVAYLCFNYGFTDTGHGDNDLDTEGIFLPLTNALETKILSLISQLSIKLPRYMVPTMFVPCRHIPLTTSKDPDGKRLDRNKLLQLTAGLSPDDIARYSLEKSKKEVPDTAMELKLQELWASVLQIPAESIGKDDSFLQLGGDSISAIQLVSLGRRHNIKLTVETIFKDPRLSQVAATARFGGQSPARNTAPFSLLPADQLDDLIQQAREQCGLSDDQVIEDAYPCTPLQEGLMALSVTQPGSYMARFTISLPPGLDTSQLKAVVADTAKACANTRTRVVLTSTGPIQVVVDEDIVSRLPQEVSLSEAMKRPLPRVSYGTPLSFFTLIHDQNGSFLVLDMHHTIYDGFTSRHMVQILHSACDIQLGRRIYHKDDQDVADPVPFSNFVQYLQSLNEADTQDYWLSRLEGANTAKFPPISPLIPGTRSDGKLIRKMQVPVCNSSNITTPSLLRGAWALVIARYLESDDVVFGCTVSGRSAPVPYIESIMGPTIATVPVRVQFRAADTVSSFLDKVQRQANEMIPFEHIGLQNISKFGQGTRDACQFRNHLVILPAGMSSEADEDTLHMESTNSHSNVNQSFDAYPLVLQCVLGSQGTMDVEVTYDTRALLPEQISNVCNQFEHAIAQLSTMGKARISDINLCAPQDVEQILRWNAQPLNAVSACVYDLIDDYAKQHPKQEAIHAWDGRLTYEDLEQLSGLLASHLIRLGVCPEMMVPVCFEKSKWAVVAMLAIMRAGAVYVPLDPLHPASRRKALIKTTDAKIVILSPETATSCEGMVPEAVVLSGAFISQLSTCSGASHLSTTAIHSPLNAAYVVFTSGSTGEPKGLVVEQGALCSSIMGHGVAYGLSSTSRVLQFSNFTFDGSLSEILTPLVFGGTVCIPSETQRLEHTAAFIRDARVDVAILTPSFARTLRPQDVPCLKTLVLSGEALSKDHLTTWCNRVKLVNAYGPSEVCIDCTSHVFQTPEESPNTIGRAHNAVCWIVEPENHQRLAPIGSVGELLVHSPGLARGYLKDEEKTKTSFINGADWLAAPVSDGMSYRLYKTGDLVRYSPNGTIEYIGRKDTQFKLRGQRLEPGEIEYHIKAAQPGIEHATVDVISRGSHETLAAFLTFKGYCSSIGQQQPVNSGTRVLPVDDTMRATISGVISELGNLLPMYMVPTLFIPLSEMPFNSSMKIDKKQLQTLAKSLSAVQLSDLNLSSEVMIEPTTELEFMLRQLWAEVLDRRAEDIGKNDSFLQIGGDSITAIQLVALARRHNIELRISSIFKDARLSQVAATARVIDDSSSSPSIAPFGLLPADSVEHLLRQARAQCGLVGEEIIEDAYPTTPLQEGLMALAVTQPGTYIAQQVYELPGHIDLSRFKYAWGQTVSVCVNLRTRIVSLDGYSAQVVIKHTNNWDDGGVMSLESAIKATASIKVAYGSPLCHYALARSPDSHKYYFVWTIHHSVFDGWSVELIKQRLHNFYYDNNMPPPQPYCQFISYIASMDQDASRAYWKAQLLDAKRATFPVPRTQQRNHASQSMIKTIRFPQSPISSITRATVLRAAWAITLAQYCNTDDICFGTSVSGRHAPVSGLENMTGPLVATVPVRIHLNRQQSVVDFLQDVQRQASDMVAYEQFGLQNIAKVSSEAQEACDFSSLLVVQPTRLSRSSSASVSVAGSTLLVERNHALTDESARGYFNYPLIVQAILHDTDVEFHAIYNPLTIQEVQIKALSHHFDQVVQQLLSQDKALLLAHVSLSGPWDIQQAMRWNSDPPENIDACIHNLIEEQAQRRPDATAICAWDGKLTYAALDQAANRLAHHLRARGLVTEDLVPVCFEKSIWAFVSSLAVNKAGGAWVPLDPSHPIRRRKEIIQQIQAKMILTSPGSLQTCRALGLEIVEVTSVLDRILSQDGLAADGESSSSPACDVSSRNAAYVLFTSGSTGAPKGVVIEHQSLCTSQVAITKRLGITPETRMLQFSSHVFDAYITESIATLISGGCFYIPSDHIRINKLQAYIREMHINWALLTPVVIQTLEPEELPSLEVLLVGGEAVGRGLLETWFSKVRLINCWGPSETCVMSTTHEWKSLTDPSDSPLTIGRPLSGYCWIIDPQNFDQLTPVGCIGEIVVQGPTLLREYLNDREKTRKSLFTSKPRWMPQAGPWTSWGRFYKTGDLAFYNPDGTIQFFGRRDTQVKLRGQRIELGEVEYAIRTSLDGLKQAVVGILPTEASVRLVAYFCFSHKTTQHGANMDDIFLSPTQDLESRVSALISQLRVKLPRHLVPTIFIPCRYIPFNISNKVDRNKLLQLTNRLSQEDLGKYSLLDMSKRAPETTVEVQMQSLWASILKIPAETIGKDDSFLQIGGDSITAIQLVILARSHGIGLTVASILKDARLSSVAAAASRFDESGSPAMALESVYREQ